MAEVGLNSAVSSGQDSQVLTALADLFKALTGDSPSSSGSPASSSCGCDGESKKSLSLDATVEGDPHVNGEGSVDGQKVSWNYTTKGGNGDEINMLDTDNLDYTAKFDSIHGANKDTTWQTENTITAGDTEVVVNADDTVTIDGREVENGTYECNGNTITVEDGKVTVETAEGDKIVIKDKGNYLDTEVDIDDMETSEIGGMLGDNASGNVDEDAEKYVIESATDSSGNEMNSEAVSNLLRSLGNMLMATNEKLGNLLVSLADFISSSQGVGQSAAT